MVSEEWARGQRVSRETYSAYTGGLYYLNLDGFKKTVIK